MLLDHDGIDGFGVSESQETKPSRPSTEAVTHDRAFYDLAELGKIILERFYLVISTYYASNLN